MATKAQNKTRIFVWSGFDNNQNKVAGEIEADNLKIAKLLLKHQGLHAKKVQKKKRATFSFSAKKIKTQDIVFFSRQLSTMLDAGIPLTAALRSISQGLDHATLKTLVNAIREDVETGTSMSVVLKKYPKQFNQLYTSLVTAGEESGTLDVLMRKIADSMEKIETIKSKVKSAMFYPALVVLVALIVITVILIFVIPEFESLFNQHGADLPALTRAVVNLSHFIHSYWLEMTLGIATTVVIFRKVLAKSVTLKLVIDRLLLKTPVIGKILLKSIIARISRTLSTMSSAGIPLINCLEIVANTAGNKVYEKALICIRREVCAGHTLESAVRDSQLFPGMVIQMVATGEETGELEMMLDKVAKFYETEVDNSITVISSLIEPLLIALLGGTVGVILVAMYMPIFAMGSVF